MTKTLRSRHGSPCGQKTGIKRADYPYNNLDKIHERLTDDHLAILQLIISYRATRDEWHGSLILYDKGSIYQYSVE